MSTVVSIRGRKCHRRKNRAEDSEAIRLRRLLSATEATAFEESNAEALAISWVIARKLPCSNLRLVAGTLDERTDFEVRSIEVEIARAEREAFEAKIRRTRLLYGRDAAAAMYAENDCLFERYRQATMDLALTPAPTRRDLDRKKAAIGRVWLVAEGAWYDRLRAAVAADEQRLATKTGRA